MKTLQILVLALLIQCSPPTSSTGALMMGGGTSEVKKPVDSNGVPLPNSLVPTGAASTAANSAITIPVTTANARPSLEASVSDNPVFPPRNPVTTTATATASSTATSELATATATATAEVPIVAEIPTEVPETPVVIPVLPPQAQEIISNATSPTTTFVESVPIINVPSPSDVATSSSTSTSTSTSVISGDGSIVDTTDTNTSTNTSAVDSGTDTSTSTGTSTSDGGIIDTVREIVNNIIDRTGEFIAGVVDTVIEVVTGGGTSVATSTDTSTSTATSTNFADIIATSTSTSTNTSVATETSTNTSTSVGGGTSTSTGTGTDSFIDSIIGAIDIGGGNSNTNPLTNNTSDVAPSTGTTTVPEGTPTPVPPQAVPTFGPAVISGKFIAVEGDNEVTNICGRPLANSRCLDYTRVIARVIAPSESGEVVIKSVYLNSDGTFEASIADLPNNNYRVLIRSGNLVPIEERHGLNSAYQDFTFIYDASAPSGVTTIALPNIPTERLYYTSGLAKVKGEILTSGFVGDVVIPSRSPVPNTPVKLFAKQYSSQTDWTLVEVAETTSNNDGVFEFNTVLENGRYVVFAYGSVPTTFGRNYNDVVSEFTFQFEGYSAAVATVVEPSIPFLVWQKALTGGARVSGSVKNNFVNNDTDSRVSVKVKNPTGAVLGTESVYGSGSYTISLSELPEGTYTVEVSGSTIYTTTGSFAFVPHSAGSTKNISVDSIGFYPLDSQVTMGVYSGSMSVPNSRFNFKPSSVQNPINLVGLFDIPVYRDLAKTWMQEACGNSLLDVSTKAAAIRTCTNSYGSSWTYSTYTNQADGDITDRLKVVIPGGRWNWFVSATGFKNSTPLELTTNGEAQILNSVTLFPTVARSQIRGSVVVTDTPTNSSTTTNANLSNLIVIVFGTQKDGIAYAHTAKTVAGKWALDADSKVVALLNPTAPLADKVNYVLSALYNNTASPLATSGLAVANNSFATVDIRQTNTDSILEYNFRAGSYSVAVVDPMGYIRLSEKTFDTLTEATENYITSEVVSNKTVTFDHFERSFVAGGTTNVFNITPIGGVKVSITTAVGGAAVRDCTGTSCSLITNRVLGAEQIIGEVSTDSTGKFRFDNLSPGNYTFRFEASGYTTIVVQRQVAVGGVTVPVALTPNSGFGKINGRITIGNNVDFPATDTYDIRLEDLVTGAAPPYATLVKMGALYDFTNVSAGAWKLTFTSAKYKTVTGVLEVQDGQNRTFDIITGINTTTVTSANIVGKALNASSNNSVGMSGLRVVLMPGLNVRDTGLKIAETTTALDGSFSLNNIPPGNYTGEFSGSGVITKYSSFISNGTSTPASQNVLVSPVMPPGDIRIVLRWLASPADLDSHLQYGDSTCRERKSVTDSTLSWCMNGYNMKSKLGGDVLLDVDVTNGWGPETVTLKNTVWTRTPIAGLAGATFVMPYFVIDYGSTGKFNISGATLDVYSDFGTLKLNVPNYYDGASLFNVGGNQYWDPFCINKEGVVVLTGSGLCTPGLFLNKKY